jgi:hypothetical protein
MRLSGQSLFVLVVFMQLAPSLGAADAIPVELRHSESGWQLLRGGEPYLIRGAGGT